MDIAQLERHEVETEKHAVEQGNRTTERCQALAPALKEKPLQNLILSGNDCGATGAKAVGCQTVFSQTCIKFLSACFFKSVPLEISIFVFEVVIEIITA